VDRVEYIKVLRALLFGRQRFQTVETHSEKSQFYFALDFYPEGITSITPGHAFFKVPNAIGVAAMMWFSGRSIGPIQNLVIHDLPQPIQG
jgi:hypothetical protein